MEKDVDMLIDVLNRLLASIPYDDYSKAEHQDFRIDQVLRTAQCNDIYFIFLHQSPNKESTNACFLKICKSSNPSPRPMYLTGICN